jgi:hypothetical protein
MGVIIIAYQATYSDTDVAPVVVDTLVKTGAGIGTFATVIGLLVGLAIGVAVFKMLTKK